MSASSKKSSLQRRKEAKKSQRPQDMPRIHFVCLLSLLVTSWLVNDAVRAQAQAAAQVDPLDAQRSARYIARLVALEESRIAMRDRASTLVTQTPDLEQELRNWLATSMVSAGVLQRTPAVVTVPTLLQTYRTYRGQSGEIYLSPELLLWYTFQDNTLVRRQLLL